MQMPTRDPSLFQYHFNTGGTGLGLQSPQSDQRETYGSPSSVLPRHSRGMDFSRAATNLHHSTVAEHNSPDSSPTISQKAMLPPSRRGSTMSMSLDSPRIGGSGWSWSQSGTSDKMSMPRSVGSTNAMTSDASSSSSDDEMDQEEDMDPMLWTPQANKSIGVPTVTPYEPKQWDPTEATTPTQMQSPSAFSSYRRNIMGKRNERSLRHHPYRQGIRTSSPEPAFHPRPQSNGSIGGDAAMKSPQSRRESLNLGMGNALHISTSNDDPEDSPLGMSPATPGVVRRPVTRRSNMLPRSKNFARIRATLQEESCPVDSEVRRESEVVRQVRGNDVGLKGRLDQPPSPNLTPSVPNLSTEASDMTDKEASGVKGGLASGSFADLRRESQNRAFWHGPQHQPVRSSTPPPMPPFPNMNRHRSSSGMSEDISSDSPQVSTPPSSISMTTSADPKPSIETAANFQPPNLPTAAEMSRKINNKRRREDDFDVNSLKRRAVSPGMSAHSSPVLGQSPNPSTGIWPARLSREGSLPNSASGSVADERERSASVVGETSSGQHTSSGSAGQSTQSQQGHPTPNLGPKRVGMQGMTDTNDGLMTMTLE